jgi:hypothetical protein
MISGNGQHNTEMDNITQHARWSKMSCSSLHTHSGMFAPTQRSSTKGVLLQFAHTWMHDFVYKLVIKQIKKWCPICFPTNFNMHLSSLLWSRLGQISWWCLGCINIHISSLSISLKQPLCSSSPSWWNVSQGFFWVLQCACLLYPCSPTSSA